MSAARIDREIDVAGLARYRALFYPSVAEKGRALFQRGEVRRIDWDLEAVPVAQVQVGWTRQWRCRLYDLGAQGWHGDCTCGARTLCLHVFAAALAVEEAGPPTKRFRDQWQPEIEGRLGRKLTADEARLLDALNEVFRRYAEAGKTLRAANLHPLGFSTPEAERHTWDAVYADWWGADPPGDPWALWQYLACDLIRAGRELPEVFRTKTDLGKVGPQVAHILEAREIAFWKDRLVVDPRLDVPTRQVGGWTQKVAGFRLRLAAEGWKLEAQAAGAAYRPASQALLRQMAVSNLAAFLHLPPDQLALVGILLTFDPMSIGGQQWGPPVGLVWTAFQLPAAAGAIVGPQGGAWSVEPETLRWRGVRDPARPGAVRFDLMLGDRPIAAHLAAIEPEPWYVFGSRVYRGPPDLPAPSIPEAALQDPDIVRQFFRRGVELPEGLTARVRRVELRLRMQCWIEREVLRPGAKLFCVRLTAQGPGQDCAQIWVREGWLWQKGPPKPAEGEVVDYHCAATAAVVGLCHDRVPWWNEELDAWTGEVGKDFPEVFRAWRARLPVDVDVQGSPEIAALLGAAPKARYVVKVARRESEIDWFDVKVELAMGDVNLTPEEVALLRAARGRWLELPLKGWRRLEVEGEAEAGAMLARLGAGIGALEEGTGGAFHALQLGESGLDSWLPEEAWQEIAVRARELRAVPAPALPAGLRAELRPYQREGFHFLAHLTDNGLGGVLADDMGLGKTVQTIAWLMWLRERSGGKLRALVVCPKSVAVNWAREAARFAPGLRCGGPEDEAEVRIVNYAQLRLRQKRLAADPWDAVVLDEGQNIKNPASATAKAARSLRAKHRVVLTGTPVENRLLDLWSLFAFAQPGLLGSQAGFLRDYPERTEAEEARARLSARVRHFLLRRTKGQVAADLPARVEEDVICELEGRQAELYKAELKRARAMVAGVDGKGFAAVRFNVLQSLLRLRQICCDPRLLVADAEPGAKLEALFDVVEPLRAEGHKVLIFSQFVEMLRLIAAELNRKGMSHLMLTGQTENRQALVDRFQSEAGLGVFLISLKAGGSGLNLTAASYVVLFDPWWNPAVEAQAIDRTHRIGQTQKVIAYRLIAKGTVEEKIRALQKEKAELAAAVVQEESLAKVMDLETLRGLLG